VGLVQDVFPGQRASPWCPKGSAPRPFGGCPCKYRTFGGQRRQAVSSRPSAVPPVPRPHGRQPSSDGAFGAQKGTYGAPPDQHGIPAKSDFGGRQRGSVRPSSGAPSGRGRRAQASSARSLSAASGRESEARASSASSASSGKVMTVVTQMTHLLGGRSSRFAGPRSPLRGYSVGVVKKAAGGAAPFWCLLRRDHAIPQ
jgi:hypothetical protein